MLQNPLFQINTQSSHLILAFSFHFISSTNDSLSHKQSFRGGFVALTQTLDAAHCVSRGGPGLVGDQGQLAKVLTPATARYFDLCVVRMVCFRLQGGEQD